MLLILAGGVIFYVYNLERVPLSNRLRFNCVPKSWEESLGRQVHEEILQQYAGRVLPAGHPSSVVTRKVLKRLVGVSREVEKGGEDKEEEEWEVVVIDDVENVNAFVVPG